MRWRWPGLALALVLYGCGGDDTPDPDMGSDVAPADGQADVAPADMAPVDRGVVDGAAPDGAPPTDRGLVDVGVDAAVDAAVDMAPLDCGECPGNQACDPETGACVESGACTADEDCLDGRHCEAGACVDDCFEDAACPGTRLCDLDTGRCPEPAMCLVPEDCDGERLCIDSGCVDPCGPDAPCPGSQQCGADGRCVEGDGCAVDDDCSGARICVAGACEEACVEDADCPGTRSCDPVSGRCPEPALCFAEGDCDPGRVCDGGQCTAVCDDDDACPGRQQCGGDGVCVEPVACIDDVDCRGARFCLEERCADPCRENADCPGALVCDIDSGRCGEAPQGCVVAADCVGDRLCVEGICADPECAENADCPEACVDRICGEVPVACVGDAACAVGAICAPVGVCADPERCGGDDDCAGLRPVCIGGRCVACGGDADCAPTEFCDGGQCLFFDGCGADADCPGRRQCADGRCVPGPCAGDAFDGLGEPPVVPARSWTDLVLCDGDVDRYRVELAADEGLRVTVRHDAAIGDLALRLTAPGAPALVYVESDGGAGIEVVGLAPSPAAQVVDVEIDGRTGFDVPYVLTIERLGPDECPADPLEVPFANDTRDQASPIGGAPVAVRLCADDVDWLGFEAAAGTVIEATALADDLPEILLIDLYDGGDEVLASARIEERALVLRGTVERSGPHALRFAGAEGPITLDVSLSTQAAPDAVERACDAVVDVPLDAEVALPATLPVDRFESSCAPGAAAPDHVVRLQLDRAGTVSLRARPDDRQTSFSVRAACDDVASEVACVFGADADVELDAGVWFVVIESSGAVPQRLEIRAR